VDGRRRTVLLTRPQAASERLAERLEKAGLQPLIAPALRIDPVTDPRGLPAAPSHLAFTSMPAVQRYATLTDDRRAAVFAVGTSTAQAAREAGFAEVLAADGSSRSLLDLIRIHVPREAGLILHPRGRESVGDIAATLSAEGRVAAERVLYAAEPVLSLPGLALRALTNDAVGWGPFFSARSVRALADLLPARSLAGCRHMRCVAISPRVAAELAGVGAQVIVAVDHPSEEAVMQRVESDARNALDPSEP